MATNKIGGAFKFPNGDAAQMLPLTGVRVNATAGSSSTAEAALPTGARLVVIRATGPIAIRFGNTGMSAAAIDANSILFPAGEAPYAVPLISDVPATHFRVIRASASDAYVQMESVVLQSS